MRWENRFDRNMSRVGSFRVVEKFLLHPKSLDGITKWLEHARIKQKYVYYPSYGEFDVDFGSEFYWRDMGWADED